MFQTLLATGLIAAPCAVIAQNQSTGTANENRVGTGTTTGQNVLPTRQIPADPTTGASTPVSNSTTGQNVLPSRQSTTTPPNTHASGSAQTSFAQWDANGDGVVDQNEFSAAQAAGLSTTPSTSTTALPTSTNPGIGINGTPTPGMTQPRTSLPNHNNGTNPQGSNTAPNVNQGQVTRPGARTNPSSVPAGGGTGTGTPNSGTSASGSSTTGSNASGTSSLGTGNTTGGSAGNGGSGTSSGSSGGTSSGSRGTSGSGSSNSSGSSGGSSGGGSNSGR